MTRWGQKRVRVGVGVPYVCGSSAPAVTGQTVDPVPLPELGLKWDTNSI